MAKEAASRARSMSCPKHKTPEDVAPFPPSPCTAPAPPTHERSWVTDNGKFLQLILNYSIRNLFLLYSALDLNEISTSLKYRVESSSETKYVGFSLKMIQQSRRWLWDRYKWRYTITASLPAVEIDHPIITYIENLEFCFSFKLKWNETNSMEH